MFLRVSGSRFLWLACCLGGLFLSSVARAGDVSPVKIVGAWVRAVPGSVGDSAAFMRIENTGDSLLVLTSGSTPIAGGAMLMKTTERVVNGVKVLGMGGLDAIEIPPHGEAILKPGGNHLMLMNLNTHPHPGEMVTVTLQFAAPQPPVTVQMPARIDAGS